MEYMWNFNGIHIYSASNSVVGRMLVQDDVMKGEWEIKENGGLPWSRKYGITYISPFTHDSNNIPTAIPMFSISSNTTGLI